MQIGAFQVYRRVQRTKFVSPPERVEFMPPLCLGAGFRMDPLCRSAIGWLHDRGQSSEALQWSKLNETGAFYRPFTRERFLGPVAGAGLFRVAARWGEPLRQWRRDDRILKCNRQATRICDENRRHDLLPRSRRHNAGHLDHGRRAPCLQNLLTPGGVRRKRSNWDIQRAESAAVSSVTPLAGPTCREFVAKEDAMKLWPWFHKSENNGKIDADDWLSELVAIFVAALLVAAFVFVGDS